MKKSALLGMCLAAILSAGTLPASAQSHSPSTQWHWNKGKIMIDSPERPAGQKDVIGLTLPKMKTVRVGFVGLGMRGPDAVADFALLPGVEIVALCDFEEPRAAKLNETLPSTDWRPQPSIRAPRATRPSAAATTLTSSISPQTGSITPSWHDVRWSTARTWPTRCHRP